MTKTLIALIAFASMSAGAATNQSSASVAPGDACRTKEDAISYAVNGDALACINNKLVVIAAAPMVGQPCWGGPNAKAVQGATEKVVCRRVADHAEWRPVNESVAHGSAYSAKGKVAPVFSSKEDARAALKSAKELLVGSVVKDSAGCLYGVGAGKSKLVLIPAVVNGSRICSASN